MDEATGSERNPDVRDGRVVNREEDQITGPEDLGPLSGARERGDRTGQGDAVLPEDVLNEAAAIESAGIGASHAVRRTL
jgi:hypothetical protein